MYATYIEKLIYVCNEKVSSKKLVLTMNTSFLEDALRSKMKNEGLYSVIPSFCH